jgi:hypothetical protein
VAGWAMPQLQLPGAEAALLAANVPAAAPVLRRSVARDELPRRVW